MCDRFSFLKLFLPAPRYTLVEIAQRIAMRKGVSFESVHDALLDLVEGKEVPCE